MNREELLNAFFEKDSVSYEILTQEYYITEVDDMEFTEAFLVEAFNFCGCGCISMSINFLKDILNCYVNRGDKTLSPYLHLDKTKVVCVNDNITDFILHWLDAVELTEHGSSVYGSWLTEKGKALKDWLNEIVKEEN